MEGKQLTSEVAPAVAAASMSMQEEAMRRPMEQLKQEAIASTKLQQGWTTALEWVQWASIKSKARAAGDYAVLRTRQGITMLGEPEFGVELFVKTAAASDECSRDRCVVLDPQQAANKF
ncbi:unnamed protein product [Urochloa humidicola]